MPRSKRHRTPSQIEAARSNRLDVQRKVLAEYAAGKTYADITKMLGLRSRSVVAGIVNRYAQAKKVTGTRVERVKSGRLNPKRAETRRNEIGVNAQVRGELDARLLQPKRATLPTDEIDGMSLILHRRRLNDYVRENYRTMEHEIDTTLCAPLHEACGCRWPMWGHDEKCVEKKLVCNNVPMEGSSYCMTHRAVSARP